MERELNYKHYISLGFSCYVAIELEKLAMRDASYPLDWIASYWPGVEECINTHFSDLLNINYLYQKKKAPHVYRNKKYEFDLPHDFSKMYSLKSQIKAVRAKYDRRIERFYKSITEPTLFFRYIETANELEYIEKNYSKIISLLKSYCNENDIIFISHEEPSECSVPNLYFVKKDEGMKYTKTPLSQNKELYELLKNAYIHNKEKNIEFEKQKSKGKKLSKFDYFKYRCRRFSEKHLRKEYKHSKQC